MLKTKFFEYNTLTKSISEYYDSEMNSFDLIEFEAKLQNSSELNEFVNKRYLIYLNISNSIKRVLNRLYNSEINDQLNNKMIEKLIIDINTSRFKSFYEHLRDSFLNILRDNPK